VWATAALIAAGCTSEPVGPPSGPSEGSWEGPELRFVVRAGRVEDLVLAASSCQGEDGCSASFGGAVAGHASAMGAFIVEAEDIRVEGSFQGQTLASGARYLGGVSGCCQVAGAWTAAWVAPLDGPIQAGRGAAGRGRVGAIDWDGASSGSIHPGPAQPLPTRQAETLPADDAQRTAAARMDAIRAAVGVAPASFDADIATAAAAHAAFYVQHAASYQAKGLSAHAEDASFGDGYTGNDFATRMKAAGFGGSPSAEVMAFTGGPESAITGWMDTLYHRLPLIEPATVAYGYGQAKLGKSQAEVMDLASGKAALQPVVVWPVPGAVDVPRSWSGAESPQPKPPPGGYPSGPMITAHLPAGAKVKAHALLDEAGGAVAHVYLDAGNDPTLASYSARAVALYAEEPLAAASTYVVRLTLDLAGAEETLAWRFTTRP
jgi:uncharacterized protein YkwD